MEIVASPLVEHEHALAIVCRLLFLGCEFAFLYFNIIFLGEPAQSVRIGHLLVFHYEVDGVASLAAGKAMANALGGGDDERRCLVIVERAQTLVVHASLAQRDKFRYDIDDVRRVHYLVDGGSVNHLFLLFANGVAKINKKKEITQIKVVFFVFYCKHNGFLVKNV